MRGPLVFFDLPPTERAAAVDDVIASFSRYDDGERINAPITIVITTAQM